MFIKLSSDEIKRWGQVLLMTDWILGIFGTNRQQAQKRYQQFVKEGINGKSPMDDLQEQIVIGNKVFVEKILGNDKGQRNYS
jgi:hypothetical protein